MQGSDAEAMFSIKRNPMVTAPYGMEPHASLDQTKKWVNQVIANYKKGDSLMWVICLRGSDRGIGICCYWHMDKESLCAEVGYELHQDLWGKGIMSEALAPVLSYGFDGLGLHRIEACPLADNLASNSLLVRFGFRLEGTLRDRVRFKGRFIDQLYYSLLKGELKAIPPS
jgi:RimJ/RimL family protein N-acetyltransferase